MWRDMVWDALIFFNPSVHLRTEELWRAMV